MKIYVVEEHICEGCYCNDYHLQNDSCNVYPKSFWSRHDAYNYARQKAFELMQTGWLYSYYEDEDCIYISVDGVSASLSKYMTLYQAKYSVHEIDINI